MTTNTMRGPRGAVTAKALALALSAAAADEAMATPLVAISGPQTLVTFDSAAPGTIVNTIEVQGLVPSESIVAIDRRPLNNLLYVLTNQDRVYLIESCTGTAVAVGASIGPLAGNHFGFDFNPTADRLRIVSDAEENFRFNPVTGTVVDTDLGTAGTQFDTSLPPGTVVAAAYDRNDIDAGTPTSLYVIDAAADQLLIQGGLNGVPSPNGGTLSPVGNLGVDASAVAGFDVFGGSEAWALLNVAGVSRLYRIDLITGMATQIGATGVNGLSGLTAIVPVGIFANGFETP